MRFLVIYIIFFGGIQMPFGWKNSLDRAIFNRTGFMVGAPVIGGKTERFA